MRRRQKLFLSVLGISYAGSLPPGVLNTGVVGLAAGAGAAAAAWFGLGAIIAEMMIVRIAHAGIGAWTGAARIDGQGRSGWSWWLRWLGVGISLVVMTLTILHFRKMAGAPSYGQYPFFGGMLLSVLNPLHLPFWLGWTAVLRGRKLLADARIEYNLFSAAIGAGTALAFLTYGFAGQLILQLLHHG